MENYQVFEKYCTGCGLCSSYKGVKLQEKEDGFKGISLYQDLDLLTFCQKTCPAAGLHLEQEAGSIWGKYEAVYEAYATNEEVRFKAASGGVTTAMAIFLLEKGYVDGIIQIGKSLLDPFETTVFCNTTREEVLHCTGSRYIDSSPLSTIMNYLGTEKKYAFIGRPCDIISLYNFLNWNPQYRHNIYCTLSFFCAGAPSKNASIKMVEELGGSKDNCKDIRYRGEGWPGKATIIDKQGKSIDMDYIDSWNKILGRDVRRCCKFCVDGTGEFADISSGDLWLLDETNVPIFEENEGRNITFARTELGKKLLVAAQSLGYLCIEDYQDCIEELKYIQPYHFKRKETIYSKIIALKMLRRPYPLYNLKILKNYAKKSGFIDRIRTFLGTIKRIFQGKI